MRVLLITSAYPANPEDPRGVFMHRLARALHAAGAEIRVLTAGAPNSPRREVREGVEIHRATYWIPRYQRLAVGLGGIVPNLRERPWLILQVLPLTVALTLRALRLAGDCDVVHAHWVYPGGIAGLAAARRYALPLVVTTHGGDLNLARRSVFLRRLSAAVSKAADLCIGVSAALVEDFQALGVPADRTVFVPLGVERAQDVERPSDEADAELDRFASHGGIRLLYVGSLIPRKSVDTLLAAHHELKQRGYSPVSALVGSGPAEPRLRRMAADQQSSEVIFAGFQAPARTQRWLALSDLVVLPSLSEGRPVAVMEAMASGKAVVATDVPGTRELVQHGRTGLLFPPRDVMALADCIEALIKDRDLRRKMGQRAAARIEEEGLLVSDVAQRHLELYRGLRTNDRR